MPNACTVVSSIIIATTLLDGVLGFAALIAMFLCAGGIENALQSPTDYLFIEIFSRATRSPEGATAIVCVIQALTELATCCSHSNDSFHDMTTKVK